MRILIVNRALGSFIGGGEINDLNAARYLMKRGHDITLITSKPLFGTAKIHFADLPVIYLKTPWLFGCIHYLEKINTKLSAAVRHFDRYLFEWAVLRWLRYQRKKFDLVQMCSLFNMLPGRLLTEFNIPCVSWLPGPPSGLMQRKIRTLIQYRNFAIFTHGTPEKYLMDMGLKKGHEYEIIEPGIELDIIDQMSIQNKTEERAQFGFHESSLLGVTVARLIQIKNHNLLLEAIALSKGKGVIWNWIFAGDGPLIDHLKQKALSLGIEKQVRLLGYIDRIDIHRLLSSADLFALVSVYESFSIATLEAMAHSLPVIGTRVGYLQRLIEETETGILVPSDDVQSLVDALVKMADPETRNLYRGKGRVFVERFDWPYIAEKLEALYLRLQSSM
jgi:glycosyltransferase involved in cell wall biosynthesis